jgi:hypothetical protein
LNRLLSPHRAFLLQQLAHRLEISEYGGVFAVRPDVFALRLCTQLGL